MSKGTFELLALENPLLDIQAKGDQALLDKYELKANDAILAEEKHLGIYQELLGRDAKLIPGGAAQNTARGAQYILPPDSVVYIGCVGKDKYAEILETASREQGVRVEYRYDEKEPTGTCGVVITGHDRSLVTNLAAANAYKLDHLKSDKIWPLVKQAKFYYVGGYHLTVCPPAAVALGQEAAENNKTFVFSLSAPFIPQFFKDPVDELTPYCDYIIGNEAEAATWAAGHGLSEDTPLPEIAKAIAKAPKKNTARPRTAIITHGLEPTIIAVAGADGNVELSEYPVHAIEKEKIVDTNGAGDAFAGGFVAGLVQGKSLKEAVNMGQWLARLSIQELGPSYPFPKQTYAGAV